MILWLKKITRKNVITYKWEFKLHFCTNKKPHLSVKVFCAYWRHVLGANNSSTERLIWISWRPVTGNSYSIYWKISILPAWCDTKQTINHLLHSDFKVVFTLLHNWKYYVNCINYFSFLQTCMYTVVCFTN